jgi:hypothetical protein
MKIETEAETANEVLDMQTDSSSLKRQPIYVRSDYHEALKVLAAIQGKNLYELTEEILAPKITDFLDNLESVKTDMEGKDQ